MIVMAGRFQAPTTPSLAELNTQALSGDRDACLLLARRSGSCESFTEFLDRYVPEEDIAAVFDVYADSWMAVQREKTRSLLDTVEIPAVAKKSNLNPGGLTT